MSKMPWWMRCVYRWYFGGISFDRIKVESTGYVFTFGAPNKLPTLEEALNGGRKLK